MSDIGAPGASQGGQGSGMGSGHGSGNQNGNQGGGNPADANNPGVSTGIESSSGAVDTGFDFDNWGGIGIQGASTNQQHPGSHPDQNPANNPGIGYGIQDSPFGTPESVDVDYGYYDGFGAVEDAMRSPAFSPNLNAVENAMRSPSIAPSFDTVENAMRSPAISPSFDVVENAMRSPAISPNFNAVENAMRSPAISPNFDAVENAMRSPAISPNFDAVEDAMRSPSLLGTNFDAVENAMRSPTPGTAVETESTAPPTSVTGTAPVRDYRGTPSITTGPTVSPTVDPVQEARTKQLRAISVVQGWRDLFDKSKKAWGPFKNFAPAYDQRTKTAIVKDLYDKYGPALQEATKQYSQQVNAQIEDEGLGFRGLLPGYAAIRGLMGLIGLEQEHTHPAHQALLDMMEDAGLIDKSVGDGQNPTESRLACEAKGYKWDENIQACIKSGSDI